MRCGPPVRDGPNYAEEIKRALVDVRGVCDALGLTAQGGKTVQRQAGGLILRCVWHDDRTPSMSVRLGPDGTIAVKCHGCDRGGDVLSLVAAVRGLDTGRAAFKSVLIEAARLGGMWQIVDALEGRREYVPLPSTARPAPEPQAERTYPDGAAEFWAACGPVTADMAVATHLDGRALDPELVEAGDIARAIPRTGPMPAWAVCRGGSWREAGYRLVVPMYDAAGELRSVRGWRVTESDLPKRLPPSGHKASGLVMAGAFGLAMLQGARAPHTVAIVEGEPDYLARSLVTNDPGVAVLGIVSGSWGPAFAARCPLGATVAVRTDLDDAGNRYAAEVAATLARRCFVRRLRAA
jgi:CHC2-type zinc finger protein